MSDAVRAHNVYQQHLTPNLDLLQCRNDRPTRGEAKRENQESQQQPSNPPLLAAIASINARAQWGESTATKGNQWGRWEFAPNDPWWLCCGGVGWREATATALFAFSFISSGRLRLGEWSQSRENEMGFLLSFYERKITDKEPVEVASNRCVSCVYARARACVWKHEVKQYCLWHERVYVCEYAHARILLYKIYKTTLSLILGGNYMIKRIIEHCTNNTCSHSSKL